MPRPPRPDGQTKDTGTTIFVQKTTKTSMMNQSFIEAILPGKKDTSDSAIRKMIHICSRIKKAELKKILLKFDPKKS